jgi:hypothetical protein
MFIIVTNRDSASFGSYRVGQFFPCDYFYEWHVGLLSVHCCRLLLPTACGGNPRLRRAFGSCPLPGPVAVPQNLVPSMLRELDHDRLPWNVKDIDADVDDPAPARKPIIQRPAPPGFDQSHCDLLKTIGTKMEEIALA